jgi:signal transduction histidine kinase
MGCVLYLAIFLLALRRHGLRHPTPLTLLSYLLLAFSACLLDLLGSRNLIIPAVSTRSDRYWLLISSLVFVVLTWQILKIRPLYWLLVPWIAWAASYVMLDSGLIRFPEIIYQNLQVNQEELARTCLSVGWLGFTTYIFHITIRALRKSHIPMIRNRAYYWVLALIFISASDFLFIFDFTILAHILRWPGVIFAASVVIRPYMPDTRQVERIALNYLVMTFLTAIVLIIGLILTPPLFTSLQASYNAALAGIVVAIFLAALLSPLWVFSNKIVQRIIPMSEYNASQVLREYSQSLSNILEPDVLATVAVGLVSEAIEIERGCLFLIDNEIETGKNIYLLRPTKGIGESLPAGGMLSADSPITLYLRKERKPLRQSDLELLPDFHQADPNELAWFSSLSAEVYMPIYTKEDWVGLIALGPKTSGMPYGDEDLTLLATLADQTAVALQNARLVESLMRLNNDFRRAYAAMEQANAHLQRVNAELQSLDRAKSDFISVASHELRTPLTVMRGYNEMLLEDPVIAGNPFHQKLVSGIHTGLMRMNEIVSSMLDMASIDMRALDLTIEPVSLFQVTQKVIDGLANALRERRLDLEIENLRDMPEVEGDKAALEKVFYHVIVNAIKYTPDGGKITIYGVPVSPGQLGLEEGGVEIVVADTGIGIEPEYLELIFKKFYQTGEMVLHSTGKTKFKGGGPGLGLAISRGIIEAHRGKIWAESPGHDEARCPGSEFHIVLPLHYRPS